MSRNFESFYDQIARNKRNSLILLAAVFLVVFALVYVIGYVMAPGNAFVIFAFASVLAIFYVWGGYYYSDKIALAAAHAVPADGPEYEHYRNIVEGLSIAAGLPMPRPYVMKSPDINAFATGRDPKHAAVCVTTGALEKLSDAELEGVLAHELSHIRHYDIRFVTLVSVLVGLASIVSQLFLRSLWLGARSRDRDDGLGILLLLLGIVLAIVAPLVVKLVQLAISRKREYMADAGAVQLTRTPTGLISALRKIEQYNKGRVPATSATAPMYIANPFKKDISGLFRTHPPIEDRIRALEAMM